MEHRIENLIFIVSTDIPNVLVGTAFNIDDVNGGFVVHWLNNKEFHFTSSAEIFMHQLRKLSEKQLEHESDDANREDEEGSQEERERGLHMRLDHGLYSLFKFFSPLKITTFCGTSLSLNSFFFVFSTGYLSIRQSACSWTG